MTRVCDSCETRAHTRLQKRFRRRETGPGYVRFSPLSSSPSRFYHHRVAVWHRFLIELLVFSGWLETKEFVTNLPPPPLRCPSSPRPPRRVFCFSFFSREPRVWFSYWTKRTPSYVLANFSFSMHLSLSPTPHFSLENNPSLVSRFQKKSSRFHFFFFLFSEAVVVQRCSKSKKQPNERTKTKRGKEKA